MFDLLSSTRLSLLANISEFLQGMKNSNSLRLLIAADHIQVLSIYLYFNYICHIHGYYSYSYQLITPKQMASLKDKLKSKIKNKNQPEALQAFDQSCLNVQLTQGKNQLQQLKIYCSWKNVKYNRIPKLRCKWYNRTDKNYEQIFAVDEQRYQPSLMDIGSTIQVTCIPELPGVNYQGMPILLKSQPILLSQRTEIDANQIVTSGRGKIFVSIRDVKISGCKISGGNEALLQIDQGQLTIVLLKTAQTKDEVIKSIQIAEDYPQVELNRRNPKELILTLNADEQCIVLFKNSEVRDVFCLFLKIYIAKQSLKTFQKGELDKEELKPFSEGEPDQKVQSGQTITASTDERQPKEQKTSQQIPAKTGSTIQLLQMMNFKEEIKQLEQERQKLIKELQGEKDENYNLQRKVDQTNQRLQSSSKNYFELQGELTKALKQVQRLKESLGKSQKKENSKQQQMLYYKNQISLLNSDKKELNQKLSQLTQNYNKISQEISHYRPLHKGEEKILNYSQIAKELKAIKLQNEKLRLKFQYQNQEKDKLQENLKDSRHLVEQIQSEKKYIEKKYESLTNQLNSSTISPNYSSKRSNQSGSNKSPSGSMIFDEPSPLPSEKPQSFMRMINCESEPREKQILQLKQQIKDQVEENVYLRSLIAKQKKGTNSRTQLKIELFDAKKIVSRLSECLSQKDMIIQQLKDINKQVNRRNQQISHEYKELLKQNKE